MGYGGENARGSSPGFPVIRQSRSSTPRRNAEREYERELRVSPSGKTNFPEEILEDRANQTDRSIRPSAKTGNYSFSVVDERRKWPPRRENARGVV